jgi:hypothetical protein
MANPTTSQTDVLGGGLKALPRDSQAGIADVTAWLSDQNS